MGQHKNNPVAKYYEKHPEYKGKEKTYLDVIDRVLPRDLMEWQSGAYRFRPDCRTETGYYKYVGGLVERHKELTGSTITLYRSTAPYEDSTHLGCSWTPDLEVCKEKAEYFGSNEIYSIVLPSGTPHIHLDQNGFYEEEFILDMQGLGLVGDTPSAICERKDYSVQKLCTCSDTPVPVWQYSYSL